ncbi:isopenicillin N synthase family dioxygenase [Nocardioides sp.]|uniref:isopenicillin N synthase family dioxygenase n=1 Tax=Nocardioides sp. TaxID=35761 RepID=UPI0039E29341
MTSFHVPTVDISAYVTGEPPEHRGQVAEALDQACRTVGFMQIVGHGVPEETIAALATALDDFFALPLAEKKRYRPEVDTNRGYSPPRSESLSLSLGIEAANRMNDFFEAFNVGEEYAAETVARHPAGSYPANLWPEVPGFRARVGAYYAEARRVAETLCRVFEDALSLPSGFFAERALDPMSMLRLNNYALPESEVSLDGELRGMGEHTDFDIVTVLWADRVAGLQVLGSDGGWHDVQPDPGALLVNLGDTLSRWTNERWMSTLHRVNPPVVEGRIQRRRSAAFFFEGSYDTVIEALPSCLAPGETPLYEPISIGEHIAIKLAGSRGGQVNTRAGSERDRVLAAGGEDR